MRAVALDDVEIVGIEVERRQHDHRQVDKAIVEPHQLELFEA